MQPESSFFWNPHARSLALRHIAKTSVLYMGASCTCIKSFRQMSFLGSRKEYCRCDNQGNGCSTPKGNANPSSNSQRLLYRFPIWDTIIVILGHRISPRCIQSLCNEDHYSISWCHCKTKRSISSTSICWTCSWDVQAGNACKKGRGLDKSLKAHWKVRLESVSSDSISKTRAQQI